MTDIEFGKPIEVRVSELRLDRKNYRVDWKPDTTEEEIILKLFEEEDIVEMAKDIVASGGLNPQENFIATREDGKNIVLEGNRRLLAIFCILDPSRVPQKYRNQFNAAIGSPSPELKKRLSKVMVVFFESREEARPLIADKHSGLSLKQWGLISQYRFVMDEYLKNNYDLEKTISNLKLDRQKVVNALKNYSLIKYIRGLNVWDEQGLRAEINRNRLELTKMTRALQFAKVKKALGLDYDNRFELAIQGMTREKFDYIIFKFAKASLIDDEGDVIGTRSSIEEILALISKWKSEYDSEHPQSGTPSGGGTSVTTSGGESGGTTTGGGTGGTGTTTPTTDTTGTTRHIKQTHPEKYFEKLICTVEDQRLARLTLELSKLSDKRRVESFPAATALLIRALMESALRYQIVKKGKREEIERQEGKNIEEIDLNKIVTFAISNVKDLFVDFNSARGSLQRFQSNDRPYLNQIVHGHWVDPTPSHIEGIAGDIRELLRKILSDSA